MKKFNITVNGNAYEVEIEEVKAAAPAAAGVLPDDAVTSAGDDDEDTESDSYGEEVDHSSAATGLGKDP